MTGGIDRILGHVFADPALLEDALTHRSATADNRMGYERLEFVGDRVLSLVVADWLFDVYPDEPEGDLARRHVALVRRETLAEIAREVGIGAHIRMSRGEEESGSRDNDAILADVCEALIAALYRDGGIEVASSFIRRHWQARLHGALRPPQDAKTALQEWAQGRGLPLPKYDILTREGPDHAPVFRISVAVDGHAPAEGMGPSKRAAEQAAAAQLLDRVRKDG
ncbi:MAG: ribonuclease III [Alphaproteobacteria bacterium]